MKQLGTGEVSSLKDKLEITNNASIDFMQKTFSENTWEGEVADVAKEKLNQINKDINSIINEISQFEGKIEVANKIQELIPIIEEKRIERDNCEDTLEKLELINEVRNLKDEYTKLSVNL